MNLNLIQHCEHVLDIQRGKLRWLKLLHQSFALDTVTVSFRGGPGALPSCCSHPELSPPSRDGADLCNQQDTAEGTN